MIRITYPTLAQKVAPKSINCSACRGLVLRGKLYTKTNWGRFCLSCGKGINPDPLLQGQ